MDALVIGLLSAITGILGITALWGVLYRRHAGFQGGAVKPNPPAKAGANKPGREGFMANEKRHIEISSAPMGSAGKGAFTSSRVKLVDGDSSFDFSANVSAIEWEHKAGEIPIAHISIHLPALAVHLQLDRHQVFVTVAPQFCTNCLTTNASAWQESLGQLEELLSRLSGVRR